MRRLLTLLLLATTALAQHAAPPAFDVASVRPSGHGSVQRSNVPLDNGNVYGTIASDDARAAEGGLFLATHQPLWRYISFAYKLSGTQELALRFSYFSGAPRSGAPLWVTGSFDAAPEFFDISARAPNDTTLNQMRLMMQTLLADRFGLRVHTVDADAPVFALILAAPGITGPHLQPHPASDPCTVPAPASPLGELPPACGVIAHVPSDLPGQHYGARAVPIALLATSLPTMTGLAIISRPVVDQTGLPGLYDFNLTWMHSLTAEDAAVADSTEAFRDALRNQLGLKLQPTHAPLSFLILDHVEQPSAN